MTINDNIAVTGTLGVDTATPKIEANPVVVNDKLTIKNTFAVDTITERLANE